MTFEVRTTGELLASGMTRHGVDQLPRVDGLGGLRIVGEEPQENRLVRIRAAWAKAHTGSVLAGWAAAVVHGVPADFLSGTVDGHRAMPIDLSVSATYGSCDVQGLRLRRSRIPQEHLVSIDGMVLTNGSRTALDLARWTRSKHRRLAMLDLSARFGLVDLSTFSAFLDPLGGLHGLGGVRELVPLVSSRAESIPESELRLAWLEADLPSPLVNQPVNDRRGNFVARPDLLDPVSGLIGEYQGFWHKRDLAPEEDAIRRRKLESMNLTVVEIWKKDRDRVEQLLRDGYARAQARDRRMDTWECPGIGTT